MSRFTLKGLLVSLTLVATVSTSVSAKPQNLGDLVGRRCLDLRANKPAAVNFVRVYRWSPAYQDAVSQSEQISSKDDLKLMAKLKFQLCDAKLTKIRLVDFFKVFSKQTGITLQFAPAVKSALLKSRSEISAEALELSIGDFLDMLLAAISPDIGYSIKGGKLIIDEIQPMSAAPTETEFYSLPQWILDIEDQFETQSVSLNFRDTPIEDVIDMMSEITGISLIINDSVDASLGVNMSVAKMNLGKMFKKLCDDHELKIDFGNEALVVSARAELEPVIVRSAKHKWFLKARAELRQTKFIKSGSAGSDRELETMIQELKSVSSVSLPTGYGTKLGVVKGQTLGNLLDTIRRHSGREVKYGFNKKKQASISFDAIETMNTNNSMKSVASFVAALKQDFEKYKSRLTKIKANGDEKVVTKEELAKAFSEFEAAQKEILETQKSGEFKKQKQAYYRRNRAVGTLAGNWPYQPVRKGERVEDLFLQRQFVTKLLNYKQSAGLLGIDQSSFELAHIETSRTLK